MAVMWLLPRHLGLPQFLLGRPSLEHLLSHFPEEFRRCRDPPSAVRSYGPRLLYYSPHIRGDFVPFLACVLKASEAKRPPQAAGLRNGLLML